MTPTTGSLDIAFTTMAVDRLLSDAVDRGQVPGAVCLVPWIGEVVFHAAFGQAQTWPHQREVRLDRVLDLASLTNPLVTTAARLVLVDRGATALDEAVMTHLPELRHGAPGGEVPAAVPLFADARMASAVPGWSDARSGTSYGPEQRDPGDAGSEPCHL